MCLIWGKWKFLEDIAYQNYSLTKWCYSASSLQATLQLQVKRIHKKSKMTCNQTWLTAFSYHSSTRSRHTLNDMEGTSGGSVVKTLCFQHRGMGSVSDEEIEIPHVVRYRPKTKTKQKMCCILNDTFINISFVQSAIT